MVGVLGKRLTPTQQQGYYRWATFRCATARVMHIQVLGVFVVRSILALIGP